MKRVLMIVVAIVMMAIVAYAKSPIVEAGDF